jgi:hypothetical protein
VLHAVAGDGARDRIKQYLLSVFPDQGAARELTIPFEEALTEHITQVMLGMRDMDDLTVEENPQAYEEARGTLAAVFAGVSVRDFVNVYFGAPHNETEVAKLKAFLHSDNFDLSKYYTAIDFDAVAPVPAKKG